MMESQANMVGRRGEAPLVPPYGCPGLKSTMALIRHRDPLDCGGKSPMIPPVAVGCRRNTAGKGLWRELRRENLKEQFG